MDRYDTRYLTGLIEQLLEESRAIRTLLEKDHDFRIREMNNTVNFHQRENLRKELTKEIKASRIQKRR